MKKLLPVFFIILGLTSKVFAQCGGIMEPGFAFLTSSRGCAPFTANIQTVYLSSVPGTKYFVDWGDGTPEQMYTQVNATGVNMTHIYPNYSVDCGYDVTIDASNACNPRGSVVPITTQVIVWTNDVVSIGPAVYRVCQGFATDVLFTDDSDWNCFPRATRENNEPRWIQWIYGTGSPAIRIPGVQVNSVTPGTYPYLNPAPGKNPIYPVASPGQVSLPINVPATLPADIGKEFEITLKNWNQCNAYDNNLLDLNAFNPVNGDLVNGDNAPRIATARIVIVDSPDPDYVTRLGNAAGPIQSVFCIGDNIYFDDETPSISGASFRYTWEFFNNSTGVGAPLSTSTAANPTFAYPTPGQKLIRLSVKDQNAAGNCVATVDKLITISPSLVAAIQVTDLANAPITPDFCQEAIAPLSTFTVRFRDVSVGTIIATTQWRWEFYDENNVLVRQEPTGGGFSSVALGPFDIAYVNPGIYKAKLVIRDNATSCETVDEKQVRVFEKPKPVFNATRVCEGTSTAFSESSTLNPINGESIVLREWDFDYDGITFTKDPAFDNQTTFTRSLGSAGLYQVALRVTTNQHACSDILVVPIQVDALPVAAFTPDVISGCSILTVTFTNESISGQPDIVDRFVWEIDEKQGLGFVPVEQQQPSDPGFSTTFVHDFKNVTTVNRQFDVRLRVVSIHNCERISAPVTITVFPGTQSGFISINYSPFNDNCTPESVNFTVDTQTQSLSPTNYLWDISDANGSISQTSTGTTPAFNYNFINSTQAIKDFFVTLTTTLPSNCFGDSTRTIRISPVPSADFTIDTLVFNCLKMRLKFTPVQAGLLEYSWTIRENGIVVLTNTQAALEYEVNRQSPTGVDIVVQADLKTRNLTNCESGIISKSVTVPKSDGINALFTATPSSQTLPGSTVALSLTNPGPWTYMWDFGDGSTATGSTITSHTYVTYGTYRIQLTVANGDCTISDNQVITILAIPPIVDFSYAPPAGCVPLTVSFTNLSKYAEPDKYLWEFGDGQATSKAINPTYTYYEPGTYTVTLSASNATGQIVRMTKQMIIEVYARPVAQFDIKPKLVYIPGGVLYTSNQSFLATSYLWDFGDGTTSLERAPSHGYTNEGTYSILLVASNQHGCSDSLKMESAVKVIKGGQVLVPNAFSPNLNGAGNDQSSGKNDVFLPLMRGVTQFEMMIFNRWGELLFQSTDQTIGWDGYYNGRLCQQDVYMYKVSAQFENGEKVVRTGDVNLIR